MLCDPVPSAVARCPVVLSSVVMHRTAQLIELLEKRVSSRELNFGGEQVLKMS